nr:hypothetical protein [Tanacetum cinerariifolium]
GIVSFVTSVSRSTTLGGEKVVGIVGPLYAIPLRVVIPLKSSFRLVMVLLGSVPELEDEAGEGSATPTEPHHTPSPEATSSHHTTSSILLPSIPTAPIPTVTQTDTTPIIQYSRRARIAQSSALPTVVDEPVSQGRDDSQEAACPTDSGFIADQDRATIAKSSTLPHDSEPRVTSPAAREGSMQQTLNELTDFYTSLQRQHSELLAKFQAQEVEINRLKERVKYLEDKEEVIRDKSGDDVPIKGRRTNEGEAAAERISTDSEEIARVLTSLDATNVLAGETNEELGADKSTELGSNDTEEMVNVLSSMEAVNILTSGGAAASVSPGDVLPTVGVPTVSGSFPTVSAIFTTASVVTPYTRRPRGITIGSSQPMKSPIIGGKIKAKRKWLNLKCQRKENFKNR